MTEVLTKWFIQYLCTMYFLCSDFLETRMQTKVKPLPEISIINFVST